MTDKRISDMNVDELAEMLLRFKFSDCSGCVNSKSDHSCRPDGLICTFGIKELLKSKGLSEDSQKDNFTKKISKTYWIENEEYVSEYDFLTHANLNELAQFFFVHQINPCSHCGYYEKQCNGTFFDDNSCMQGIKLYLKSNLVRKE